MAIWKGLAVLAGAVLGAVHGAGAEPAGAPLAGYGIDVTGGAAPGYVADAVCADCHGGIAESFAELGMARSFYRPSAARAIENFAALPFFHAPSGRYYEMELKDDSYLFRRYRLAPDGAPVDVFERRVDWIVGSGNHARVYLYRTANGLMFELPLAWYTQSQSWGMAPGFEFHDHSGVMRPVLRRCMACHNAYPDVPEGSDTHGMPEVFPADLPEGIGCQRCHGPGAEHVALALDSEILGNVAAADVRGAIVDPGKLDSGAQRDVCYSCHYQPSVAVAATLRPGRGVYEFRPGERLDNHQIDLDIVDALRRQEERFDINHHPYRLEQSACFTQTNGALGCLSCHDPHRKPPEDERTAAYQAVCLSCHEVEAGLPVIASGTAHPEIGATDGCTDCHMPKRRTQDVIEVWMTDHKIQRGPVAGDPLAPISKRPPEVVEVTLARPNAGLTPEDARMARAMGVLHHSGGQAGYAADAIAEWLGEDGDRGFEPWLEVAKSHLRLRRYGEALQMAHGALARSPGHPAAAAAEALALFGLGETAGARDRMQSLLAEAPRLSTERFNLALMHAALGDTDAALAAAHGAVILQDTLWPAWRLIGETELARGQPAEAIRSFRKALAVEPRAPRAREGLIEALSALGLADEVTRQRAVLQADAAPNGD